MKWKNTKCLSILDSFRKMNDTRIRKSYGKYLGELKYVSLCMHGSRLYEVKFLQIWKIHFEASNGMCHFQLYVPFLSNPTHIEIMGKRT